MAVKPCSSTLDWRCSLGGACWAGCCLARWSLAFGGALWHSVVFVVLGSVLGSAFGSVIARPGKLGSAGSGFIAGAFGSFGKEGNKMEEAKFSFNVRFNLYGYDSQVTIRSDQEWLECVYKGQQLLKHLAGIGAKPDRRWEAIKNGGNGPEQGKLEPVEKDANGTPFCPICKNAAHVELIGFDKGGKHMERYKCQGCNRWLPRQLQPA